MEGIKADSGKLPFDLLSPQALNELVAVLQFGATKYARRNWELGMDHGRVFAAAQRHLWAHQAGEDRDAETGLLHVAHAMCCCMFLAHYMLTGTGTDSRPAGQKAECASSQR